ncbi:MAG: hypothetical protein AAF739_07250 [Pseudomonadota bacterium]
MSGLPAGATAAEDADGGEAIDAQALYQQAIEAEWSGAYGLARPLLEQAASTGHARANYQLGFLLMDGLGGARDVEAARRHFRVAADQGLHLALVPLIYAYDDFADTDSAPDSMMASHALLELAQRDLGMAGDTIQFWSMPLRRQIQRDLRQVGLYRGPIDGLIGQGSLNALRAFGRNRNLALPDLERPRFESLVLSQQGVSTDDVALVPYDETSTVQAARVALGGVTLAIEGESHWRLSTLGTDLLDWFPENLDETGVPAFQLPGKPRGTILRFGMPFDALPTTELGQCSMNAQRNGGSVSRIIRQCATRNADVRLIFAAEPSQLPAAGFEAQVMGVTAQAATPAHAAFELTRIEVTSPLALRLADNDPVQ